MLRVSTASLNPFRGVGRNLTRGKLQPEGAADDIPGRKSWAEPNNREFPRSAEGHYRRVAFPLLPQSAIFHLQSPWPMDTCHIADLLQPFLAAPVPATASEELSFRAGLSLREPALSGSRRETAVLSETQLQNISMYIDILLRWNERINLTAVRQPEHIVTRHFGESLFAAYHLFPDPRVRTDTPAAGPQYERSERLPAPSVLDIGSGAGFPGLPLKIWAPEIHLTLIESNHKKATFLREVIRALTLTDVDVFPGRAENFVADADAIPPDLAGKHISKPSPPSGNVVTLRAVERFDSALPVAARLVSPGGRLVLLIGQSQISRALALAPDFRWQDPLPIPLSSARVLLVGVRSF